jgi:hypothetical protein
MYVRAILYILIIFTATKRGIGMQQFMRKLTQLNGSRAKVVLEHYLFDKQIFYCEDLQTINDDVRIGIILKNQDKFVYKQNASVVEVDDNTYVISDGKLTITINVNKL